MPETTVNAALRPAEWRLIETIRGLPESMLSERIFPVLDSLLFYVRNPRCEGIGAEGFPCGDPQATCEECQEIWTLLERIADRGKR